MDLRSTSNVCPCSIYFELFSKVDDVLRLVFLAKEALLSDFFSCLSSGTEAVCAVGGVIIGKQQACSACS